MMIWWSQQIFTAEELNTLISGSTAGGFDVRDLRENTVLSGGYQAVAGFSGWFQWWIFGMLPIKNGDFNGKTYRKMEVYPLVN